MHVAFICVDPVAVSDLNAGMLSMTLLNATDFEVSRLPCFGD